jgi:monofunctional biosynthetic peptidoglycan transglycosylase
MAFGANLKAFWKHGPRWRVWLKRIVVLVLAWPLVMTLVYGVLPVPFSNLMILRLFSGNGFHKQWVSLDHMSPDLARAVISSEDQRFCDHHGVDWIEFQDAMDNGDEGPSPKTCFFGMGGVLSVKGWKCPWPIIWTGF